MRYFTKLWLLGICFATVILLFRNLNHSLFRLDNNYQQQYFSAINSLYNNNEKSNTFDHNLVISDTSHLFNILQYRRELINKNICNESLSNTETKLDVKNLSYTCKELEQLKVDNNARSVSLPVVSTILEKPRSIIFIHIGKAGGETLKEAFEFACQTRLQIKRRTQCLNNLPKDSTLSKLVHGYAHGPGTVLPKGIENSNTTTSFLFILRHPMDRFISWFGYVNPAFCTIANVASTNCATKRRIETNYNESFVMKDFFHTCFKNIRQLLVAIHSIHNNSRRTSEFCKTIAKVVLSGADVYYNQTTLYHRRLSLPFYYHGKTNYRYYYKKFMQKYTPQEVLVVRTNNLWDDVLHLEQFVGGNSTFDTIIGSKYSHGSERYKDQMNLSSTEYGIDLVQNFCCALIDEIILYKDILYRAANLDKYTKDQQFLYDVQHCYFTSFDHMIHTCATIPKQTDVLPETIDSLRTLHFQRHTNNYATTNVNSSIANVNIEKTVEEDNTEQIEEASNDEAETDSNENYAVDIKNTADNATNVNRYNANEIIQKIVVEDNIEQIEVASME